MIEGWICPRCKQVWSPLVAACNCTVVVTTTDRTIVDSPPVYTGTPETCSLEEFFKNHPDQTSALLYCPCRRCNPSCL